jgi:hypothetical protein
MIIFYVILVTSPDLHAELIAGLIVYLSKQQYDLRICVSRSYRFLT